MKALIVLAMLVAVVGCTPTVYPQYETDQALRRVIFKECMASLPAGPRSTQYNDWDEVVSECASVAYHQALVCVANCPTFPAASTPPAN